MNRTWLGLGLGLSISLGIEVQHYYLMKSGYLKFSYHGINWGALKYATMHLGYATVDMNSLTLWDSIDLLNVVLPITCLAGIVGYLYQRKAVAKSEAEELMAEMKQRANENKNNKTIF